MKKIVPAFFLLFVLNFSFAQTFTNSTGGAILEVNIVNSFPVEVSGLPDEIDSTNFGLITVCFDIYHTYISDLVIKLQSPDGNEIALSQHNGDGANNYDGTCVEENAANGPIQEAEPPYGGSYYPDQSINLLNNGQNPSGTWYLIIIDEVPLDTGHLNNFTITFGDNPPPTYTGGVCTTTIAGGCDCPDGSQDCDLLPDMTNSVKYLKDHWTEHVGYLREGVATPNIGWGPLELHGTNECYCDSILVDCSAQCSNGSYPKENVLQTIYHKKGDTMSTYTVSAGYMTYHPSHGHIHLDTWTYNTLRIRGANPDPTTWPILGEGVKNSFCIQNYGKCTEANGYCTDNNGITLDIDSLLNGGLGTVDGLDCLHDQGIFAGYYDAYDQYLPDQEIDFGTICNGQYYMVSITDPENEIKEFDETNNVAAVLIELDIQTNGNCCAADFYADTTEGAMPFQVQFIDSTIPIANSWLWDFGDGTTSTEQFPIHVYAQPGLYNVSLSVNTSTGCTESKIRNEYIHVDYGVGIADAPDPKTIHLESYPNPFTSQTIVSFELENLTEVHLYLTDVVGNIIRSYVDEFHHSGKSTFVIDANAERLSQGIYFVHAELAKRDYVLKMVKM